jgi:hypothetical protein
MLNSDSEITDFISLKDREFYDYYKKNRKKTCKSIYQYNDFKKSVGSLMSSLRYLIQEKEGGVYIQNLGYFTVFKTPVKTKKVNIFDSSLKGLLKQYRWYPYFFGDMDNNTFIPWSMSKTFLPLLNSQIQSKIKKGKKYKLYYSTLKTLILASRETRILNKKIKK